ncbi:hypothetical protein BH23CHL7_BH23CHL7_19620 [soil metagenome]
MITGIDHFIVAVPSPDRAADELEAALGLRTGTGGRHEAYGSFNRLLWLGDSYIEFLGISDPALASAAWFGPRALNVLEREGAGYVGLSLASADLATEMVRLRGQGSRLGEPAAGERRRPDDGVVRWKVATADQPDPELGHLFLIEHDRQSAEWTDDDRARRAADEHPLGGPARLARVALPVADMKQATMRVHRDLGLAFRPSLAGDGARDTSVGRQLLRLLRQDPGSMPTVVVRGGSMEREAELFGCRWQVEPAG